MPCLKASTVSLSTNGNAFGRQFHWNMACEKKEYLYSFVFLVMMENIGPCMFASSPSICRYKYFFIQYICYFIYYLVYHSFMSFLLSCRFFHASHVSFLLRCYILSNPVWHTMMFSFVLFKELRYLLFEMSLILPTHAYANCHLNRDQ